MAKDISAHQSSGKSIVRRLSRIVLVMVISCTAIVGLFSYYFYRRDSIEVGGDKALAIADSVASAIDAEQYKLIMESGETNQYWYSIKRFTDNVKVRTGVLYLYVIDKEYSNDVTYFVEGTTPDESSPMELGDTESVDVHDDKMFESLETGLSTVTSMYHSEGYGDMVSGYSPVFDSENNVIAVVGADIGMNDVMAASRIFGSIIIACVALFSIIFGALSKVYIKRNIGTPINLLTAASEKISRGDTQVELTVFSDDEIGKLTSSFRRVVENTQSQIAVLDEISEGNLTVEIIPRSERDAMSLAIKKTVEKLNQMFSDINSSTMNVSTGADQIAQSSQILACGAAQQAETVERLRSSIVDIAGKTRENTAMAEQASELAGTIKINAEQGSQQMDHMMQAVKEINEAGQSIEKVIKIIDDIAFQTNILALNAAVEAARAGQHGKGFAVVADEVRNLAAKSANAAKDTGSLIENSIEKADLGARIADETSESFKKIVTGINESSRIMGDIAKFSEEQNEAIDEIYNDINQVVTGIQQNSATTEESASSSSELSGQSEVLRELVARFRLK